MTTRPARAGRQSLVAELLRLAERFGKAQQEAAGDGAHRIADAADGQDSAQTDCPNACDNIGHMRHADRRNLPEIGKYFPIAFFNHLIDGGHFAPDKNFGRIQ